MGRILAGSISTIGMLAIFYLVYCTRRIDKKVWTSSINIIELSDDTEMSIIVTVDAQEYLNVYATQTSLGPVIIGPFSFSPRSGFPQPGNNYAVKTLGP